MPRGYKVDVDLDRVLALVNEGFNIPKISEMLGYHPRTIHTHLRRANIKIGYHKSIPIDIESVVERLRNGEYAPDIAKSINVKLPTLYSRLNDLGIRTRDFKPQREKGTRTPRRKYNKNKPSKPKHYWTEVQEQAVVNFQKESDQQIRNRIYTESLYGEFRIMVNGILFKYFHGNSLTTPEVNDIIHECTVHVYQKIHLFDVSKDKKAFSYFQMIVKNWLRDTLLLSNNIFKTTSDVRVVSIEDVDIDQTNFEESVENTSIKEYRLKAIARLNSLNLTPTLNNNRKSPIPAALIKLVSNTSISGWSNLFLLFYLLRETGLTPQTIYRFFRQNALPLFPPPKYYDKKNDENFFQIVFDQYLSIPDPTDQNRIDALDRYMIDVDEAKEEKHKKENKEKYIKHMAKKKKINEEKIKKETQEDPLIDR